MSFIIVVGSKPNSIIPKIESKKIYAANGAASIAKKYKRYFSKTQIICLVGEREFKKNFRVKRRIVNSKPNRIYVRMGKIEKKDTNLKRIKIENNSTMVQFKFQTKFFYFGILSLYLSEFFWGENLIKKIKHFLKVLLKNNWQGVSTGFYSILLSLHENPNSKIIISGIGMVGGVQYYKSKRSNSFEYSFRARVDRFMLRLLKNKYKKQLYSTDQNFCTLAKIKFFDKKKLFKF